jgi:multidrug resistance efflux pump
LFFTLIALSFIPWQQSVTGEGTVTAFNPRNRPQTIQNIIAGRINVWHVNEGQFVRKGDTLLTITEVKDDYFDPRLIERTQDQYRAKQGYMASTEKQIGFATNQLAALRQALDFSLSKARNKLIQARNKVVIDSANFEAQKVQYTLSERQFKRYQELYEKNGLISLTDLEKRRQSLQEKFAYRIESENKLLNTRNEVLNARIELSSVLAEYTDKINKTDGERSYKTATLAEARAELAKLESKISSLRVRQAQYAVLAPQDGYIVRALKAGLGETIKEGEPIATIMPSVSDKAVEMYVNAIDLPLLHPGQMVRIEFEGWPALQFSGWPGASVGTFTGKLAVVDFLASSNGLYRVLVKPDPNGNPWPEQVRLGSGARGWAMLNFVPIWYETWRQLNGFRPNWVRTAAGSTGIPDAERKGTGADNGVPYQKEK